MANGLIQSRRRALFIPAQTHCDFPQVKKNKQKNQNGFLFIRTAIHQQRWAEVTDRCCTNLRLDSHL